MAFSHLDPAAFLEACSQRRLLVLGDLMIDRYLWGQIDRISPEAPVPVVEVLREEARLGGAGNVALNLRAMGASVELIGLAGEDPEAELLTNLLLEAGLPATGLIREAGRKTTAKTRVLAGKQQVLRIDQETTRHITSATRAKVLASVEEALANCDGIILQDYDKGLLSPELIADIVKLAGGRPVFVDPKFQHFFDYQGVTLFKPNWRELATAMGHETRRPGLEIVLELVERLRRRMPHEQTLVTLGADGALWVGPKGEFHHLKGHPRDVADVSGAGDTVLAVMALALASGLSALEAGTYANLAGGLVCEEAGVVPIRPERLRETVTTKMTEEKGLQARDL